MAAKVPVDLLHWILAILPIVALLVFLVPLKWRAPEAGPMAMFTAAIVALFAFRTPWDTLAVAGARGVWDAIFILYVIWPALLLYQITKQAGAYDALRQMQKKIPEDVAVIGFDNYEIIAANLYPELTTMHLPLYEMGRWAVEKVLQIAQSTGDSFSSEQVMIPCPLVMRNSI